MILYLLGAFAVLVVYASWITYRQRVTKPRQLARPLIERAKEFCRDYTIPAGVIPEICQKVVFLGDSLCLGVGASSLEKTLPYQIAAAFPGPVRVINCATSGARAKDLARQLRELKLSLGPEDLIFVFVGGNDATHFTDPDSFRQTLNEALATLDTRGDLKLVLVTIPDFWFVPALKGFGWIVNKHARYLNGRLRKIAIRLQLKVVDLYRGGKLTHSELYCADGFHPSDAGYEKWAKFFEESMAYW